MVFRARLTELAVLVNLAFLTLEFIFIPLLQPTPLSLGALSFHAVVTVLILVLYGQHLRKRTTKSGYTLLKDLQDG